MSIYVREATDNRGPEEFGILTVETHTGTTNQVAVNNIIAINIAEEFMIPVSPYNVSTFGIVKVYNETTSTDITANISSISAGNTILVSSGITAGNEVTVTYYAMDVCGTDADEILFRPDLSSSNAHDLTKEMMQSICRAVTQKSSIDMPARGYKWADVFARTTKTEANIPTSETVVLETDNQYKRDHVVSYDDNWPIIVTGIRIFTDSTNLKLRAKIGVERGGSYRYDIYDTASTTIDFNTCSAVYKCGTGKALDIRLPLVQTTSIEVSCWEYDTGISTGSTVIVDVSAWYKPLE